MTVGPSRFSAEFCEAVVRNTLVAATEEGEAPQEAGKKALMGLAQELGIAGDALNAWYREWKANRGVRRLADSRHNEEVFSVVAAALALHAPAVNAGLLRLGRALGLALPVEAFILRARSLAAGQPRPGIVALHRALVEDPVQSPPERGYIANQVTYEGLDELQRLLLARHLGINVAIDGPPGVGKTQSVLEVARILGVEVFTRTCSGRTTESQIIAFPMLYAEDGVSVTRYVPGPLTRAMQEGAIFYGDEFNLLKEDVQKRLNSAFDDRRAVDLADGQVIQARPGFWAVLSYNPTRNLVSRDLEDSVADRFVHLHFGRWPADFKALVSATRGRPAASDLVDFNVKLGTRGIAPGPKFLRAEGEDRTTRWFDFFTGQEAPPPPYVYRVLDTGSLLSVGGAVSTVLRDLGSRALGETELARVLARFTDLLQSLGKSGEAPLLKKIGLADLREKEDLELLAIHESSARIEAAALQHYRFLVSAGWNRYLAQSYAVRLVIDQVCYGQYRERMLREQSVHSLVELIARAMRLLASDTKYNTALVTESILAGKPEKA